METTTMNTFNLMSVKKIRTSLGALVLVLLPALLSAAPTSVTLEWSPNTDPDLAGYYLYYAPHSLLSQTTTQAQPTVDSSVTKILVSEALTEYTVSNLTAGSPYFFRLTAIDDSGNESGFNVVGAGSAAGEGTEVTVTLGDYAKAPEKFLSPSHQDGVNDGATFGPQAKEVTVYDISGRRIFHESQDNSGTQIVWNGRDTDGKVVESGVYIATIMKLDGGVIHQKFAVVK